MSARVTEAQNNALVRKAIAFADAHATSDEEFAQLLRATYFTSHPVMRKQLPVLQRGARSAAPLSAARAAEPETSIYADPRYLQNARAMARRVGQKLRIMGGTKVMGSDFPDCVAVGDDAGWACTGTLIAPNVVITACHCSDLATKVFFGNDVHKKGTVIDVNRAVLHPGYAKSKQKTHDLLLLVLDGKSRVTPRKIAAGPAIDKATDGRAVGFGNVDATGSFGYGIKRMVDVPIASVACAGKSKGKTDAKAYGCTRNQEMVAGKPLLAKDSCKGDSGGPFYVPVGKGWLLAGATSRATDSAVSMCGDGGIYMRLDRYREWIEDSAKVKLP